MTTPSITQPDWYKDAIIYELHLKAFHDANGDGIGDIPGLIEKLDYIQELGITAISCTPSYPALLEATLRAEGKNPRELNLRLGLFAEMAAGARIDRDVARRGNLQAAVFGARVQVRRFGGAQPTSLDEARRGFLDDRGVTQAGERALARARRIEGSENFLFQRIHGRKHL